MPTLREIRRWLEGNNVPGLPDRGISRSGGDDAEPEPDIFSPSLESLFGSDPLPKWRPDQNDGDFNRETGLILRPKYVIRADGTDARIMFGRHANKWVSEMARDPDELDYLNWLADETKHAAGPDLADLVKVAKAYAYPTSPEAEEVLGVRTPPKKRPPKGPGRREDQPHVKARRESVKAKLASKKAGKRG